MNTINNNIRTLATIRNVPLDIHREALRLAVGVAPRVGRSGWAERQAEGLLAQASKNVEAERLARANEALHLMVAVLEKVEYTETAQLAASFLPLQGDEGVRRAREALHKIYVGLGQAPQVSASDGRLASQIRDLLSIAYRVLYHRTQQELNDLVRYATKSFSYRERDQWLCSGCEEAGSILQGHFACGF